MTNRSDDWFRKTAALRGLEASIREGQEPTLSEIDRIVRRAHEESVGDLPISRELSAYIENCHNGSIRHPQGRPKRGSYDLPTEADRVLRLALEVEEKREQLSAAGEKDPKGQALESVARGHKPYMAPSSLETLIKRGPPNYNRDLWRFQKAAVLKSRKLPGPGDECSVDGWPLDPTHPWNHDHD